MNILWDILIFLGLVPKESPCIIRCGNHNTLIAGKIKKSLYFVQRKGTVHPRTGHEGSEGEQKYSSTVSLTSALDGGGWWTPRPGRFTPGNDPVPIVQEAGWATVQVWTVLCTHLFRVSQISGANQPEQVNFALWHLIFVGPQYGTWIVSSL
jgi:hypothetical protein